MWDEVFVPCSRSTPAISHFVPPGGSIAETLINKVYLLGKRIRTTLDLLFSAPSGPIISRFILERGDGIEGVGQTKSPKWRVCRYKKPGHP